MHCAACRPRGSRPARWRSRATSSRTSRPFCARVVARLDEVDDEVREADERRELDGALRRRRSRPARRGARSAPRRCAGTSSRRADAGGRGRGPRRPRPPAGTCRRRDRPAGRCRSVRSTSTSRPQTPRSAAPYSTYVGTSSGLRSRNRRPAAGDSRTRRGRRRGAAPRRPPRARAAGATASSTRPFGSATVSRSTVTPRAPLARARCVRAAGRASFSSMCS